MLLGSGHSFDCRFSLLDSFDYRVSGLDYKFSAFDSFDYRFSVLEYILVL